LKKKKKSTSKGTVEIAGIKMYTAQSIADIFGVNIVTILRHIKKGNMIAWLMGHKYYITKENLKEFLNSYQPVQSKKRN
jgi:excisionase family DNA binding protein